MDAHHLLTGEKPQTCTYCVNENEKEWCKKLVDILRKKEHDEEIKMHIDTLSEGEVVKKNQSQINSRRKK
jgi:hypothetical protein